MCKQKCKLLISCDTAEDGVELSFPESYSSGQVRIPPCGFSDKLHISPLIDW